MTEARVRADRQTQERTERRRRSDVNIDGGQRLKLAIPPEVEARLKAEGRTPRWVNDEGNRIVNLTKYDDYDPVHGVEPVYVGTTKEGKPIKAHLHSKPTDFIKEDGAKREARRRETEKAMLRGKVPGDSHGHNDTYSSGYVDEASKIQRGGLGPP
jgi:hypothetical protein